MGDLSKNFSKSEFACKHCGVYKDMDPKLINGLQKIRDHFGKSVKINSGYRCIDHNLEKNKRVFGQHTKANAADIVIPGVSQRQIVNFAISLPQFRNGGIGIYPGMNIVHLDTRGSKARWSYINGKQRSFEDGWKLIK